MTFSSIPVIDIGGLRSSHWTDRQSVAAQLHQVCHEVGFFYIWTNDYYQSTPHRVMNCSEKARYAIPFFWDINLSCRGGMPPYLSECRKSAQIPSHYRRGTHC
jgi:isopenicillin N synthase-like dioxygenase